MEKYKADLEVIAAAFQTAETSENGTDLEDAPPAPSSDDLFQSQPGAENWSEPATEENAPDCPGEPSDNVADYLPAADGEQAATGEARGDIETMIAEAYEDNKKMVKMRLLDRNEFRATVIEKTLERVAAEGLTGAEEIIEQTIYTLRELMANLTAFCPMKDNERIIFETIPLMEGFEDEQSQVSGKKLLQKVKELHNIEVRTSSALLVSLKRKRFIDIEGGKNSYVVLLERGIKHMKKAS